MAETHEESVRSIFHWHRVAEIMPSLEEILTRIESDIDKEVVALDPGEKGYELRAIAGWAERRAVDKVRKALTRTIKRGKTSSKTIAPSM